MQLEPKAQVGILHCMKRVRLKAMPVVALSCFAALLLSTGCASKQPQGPEANAGQRIEELKQLVRAEVEDAGRQEAMFAVLDQANREVKAHAEQMQALSEQIEEAGRQYDTSREDMESMLQQQNAEALEILDVLQEAHFEMKELATEEEWAAVVARERKFLGIL